MGAPSRWLWRASSRGERASHIGVLASTCIEVATCMGAWSGGAEAQGQARAQVQAWAQEQARAQVQARAAGIACGANGAVMLWRRLGAGLGS
eukprot:scaffold89484_cov65-Phaeocystis_antarctica.AAC.2